MIRALAGHRGALWLALAAMLLRGLLPIGYMPGRSTASPDYGLVLCSAALPALAVHEQHTAHHAPPAHCSFAHSAMAALPASWPRWQLRQWQAERPWPQALAQRPLLRRPDPQARGPPALG